MDKNTQQNLPDYNPPPPSYSESESSAHQAVFPELAQSPPAQYDNRGHYYPSPTNPYLSPQGTHQPRGYQAIIIERRPSPIRIYETERQFPLAAMMFLFGWVLPPLWILGACCCVGSRNPYEAWWGKANFIMVVLLLCSTITYSIAAVTVGDWSMGPMMVARVIGFETE
ncbi:hypothetical protein CLU79DRAFT_778421 [Phycomyces nitens]|nr:hypothetical protein CLU79DRAFT_778421 [Phycomyces nitens]